MNFNSVSDQGLNFLCEWVGGRGTGIIWKCDFSIFRSKSLSDPWWLAVGFAMRTYNIMGLNQFEKEEPFLCALEPYNNYLPVYNARSVDE